jgi:DNA-binding XRE family transcriptional regulator
MDETNKLKTVNRDDTSKTHDATIQRGEREPMNDNNDLSPGQHKGNQGIKKTTETTFANARNHLREIRIENMMSKAELARKAGLSVLTVTRIENGYGCRMDTKRKILKALGLKVSERKQVFEDDK